jgi:uncharacterized protein (DUF4415 family)
MNDDSTKYHVSDGGTLTPEEIARLDAIESRFGDDTDSAETSDTAWASAVRGKHAGSARAAIAVRLDPDVLTWLRRKGTDYDVEINRILRERMLQDG